MIDNDSMMSWLSINKNAIHLLEKNLDKINWVNLSFNKNYDMIIN